ncbi:uracil-DNA glycosylase [Auriscalpium vulgare]|uniref:Uracil-DNA glycosylase n=1 Tax=Auriscalpium vulgare TaxID=40419 RepID=A0ACB8S2S4_9AGAM|nr:uracil-DNA glycosylase [Auriscalpium vulgare]
MASDARVVYHADLDGSADGAQSPHHSSGDASSATRQIVTEPAAAGVKRQRTLVDMFKSSESTPHAYKKLKSNNSASGSSGRHPAGTTVTPAGEPQSLNSIPFSQSAYIDSLTENQKRLLSLECQAMGKSWLKVLKDEIKKPYFVSLKEFLWKEGIRGLTDSAPGLKIYPAPRDIYSWSNFTPLGKVRVVIVGQDPYHGAGQAHGLCFSVPSGVPIPPSLRNIYAEIKAEYPDFEPPKHGNLTSWAENGVLMLNTCLTVRAGQPGSHFNKGWEQFTDKIVDVVDRYGGANLPAVSTSDKTGFGRGVVFLAWGAGAAKRVAKMSSKKHLILTSAHPSPYSAHKGFLGNGHFRKANEWLEQRYGADGRVDWCRLDPVR